MVLGDSGYPAGAQFDPNAPFNQPDAEFCDICGTVLQFESEYESGQCIDDDFCHPIYQGRFWVYELKTFLSWKDSQAFYRGDY